MLFVPRLSSLLPRVSPTISSPPDSTPRARSSASGASDSAWLVCLASRANPAAGGRPAFPPSLVVQVKALAGELPHRKGLPLSRFSIADIRQEVLNQGLAAEISGATIWRWLSQDAIRPWRHRSWIFPRDPLFVEKAGPILDSLPRSLARTTSWPQRFCALRRREDGDSSASPRASVPSARPRKSGPH